MATISIIRVENPAEKAEISAHILHALPDWFGLPDSTQKYIDDSRSMPFFAAVQENQAVGFAALKETSPCAGEIYVMGVLPARHRAAAVCGDSGGGNRARLSAAAGQNRADRALRGV